MYHLCDLLMYNIFVIFHSLSKEIRCPLSMAIPKWVRRAHDPTLALLRWCGNYILLTQPSFFSRLCRPRPVRGRLSGGHNRDLA
jgi:hypothetical protein